jgi:hypothetical protein
VIAEVTRLRRAGLRLRSGELSEPVRGVFELVDDDGRSTSLKRPTRIASLYEEIGVQGTRRALLTPLFDATVIRAEGNVLTVTGFEHEAVEGATRTAEYSQVWRVHLVMLQPPGANSQAAGVKST